jgi:capsular polysaccharide biosynthesis protein
MRTLPAARPATFDVAAPESLSRELTLRDLRRVLTRRWLTVVVATTICVAATLALHSLVPTTYAATTTVQVSSPTSFVRETSAGTLAAETATDVALLNAEDGASVLPTSGASQEVDDAISAGLEVGNPEGTALLELSVTATSPALAADAANVAAERYLKMRAERASQARKAYLAALDESEARASSAEVGARRLDATVYGSEVGEIVRGADAGEPSSTGIAAYLAAGVLAGLLLGVFVALLRERRDPKVRTVERLADALGAPTVATDDLRSADVGRAVGARALEISGYLPVRVGVVVPGGTAGVSSLRIAAGLKAAGVAMATVPGHGPRVELVPLPDPGATTDLEGTWWSVSAVVVVCLKSAQVAQVTRCAEAAASAGALSLGVLNDHRAEARPVETEDR